MRRLEEILLDYCDRDEEQARLEIYLEHRAWRPLFDRIDRRGWTRKGGAAASSPPGRKTLAERKEIRPWRRFFRWCASRSPRFSS